MPVQFTCKFQKVWIKAKQAMLRTRSIMFFFFFFFFFFFCTKGEVTPKSIVRSGRNSNSSEILCLFRLSASLIKD